MSIMKELQAIRDRLSRLEEEIFTLKVKPDTATGRLRQYMIEHGGSAYTKDIKKWANLERIPDITLARAKKNLGIKSEKVPRTRTWIWRYDIDVKNNRLKVRLRKIKDDIKRESLELRRKKMPLERLG